MTFTLKQVAAIIDIHPIKLGKYVKRGIIQIKSSKSITSEELDKIRFFIDKHRYLNFYNLKECPVCGEIEHINQFDSELRRCKKCDKIRHIEYHKNNKDIINKKHREYFKNNSEMINFKNREYGRKNKLLKKEQSIKRKYGITKEIYNIMYNKFSGMCHICKSDNFLLSVDHNHYTGEIRGLLCLNCNTGLGTFKDNIIYIENAIYYLENYDKKECYQYKYNFNKRHYYRTMFNKHDLCDICNQEFNKLCVDHNHDTGLIRGILCANCNVSLGKFKDSIDILQSAITYLKEND